MPKPGKMLARFLLLNESTTFVQCQKKGKNIYVMIIIIVKMSKFDYII